MIYALLLVVLVIISAVLWQTHSWVQSHALVVLTDIGEWSLVSTGWESMWPVLCVGAASGALTALSICLLVSKNLSSVTKKYFEAKHSKEAAALSELRLALNKQQADIDAEIKKNVSLHTTAYENTLEELRSSNREMQTQLEKLKRKNETLVGRLKGAQQRAMRLKKQHN